MADAIVLGVQHNGLVTSLRLARAGLVPISMRPQARHLELIQTPGIEIDLHREAVCFRARGRSQCFNR